MKTIFENAVVFREKKTTINNIAYSIYEIVIRLCCVMQDVTLE